ncbi:MAG: metallophosphoesterase [Bacilli bacterium]|nr:metallophosphoesterase [Bacilli bacterium]
MTKKEEKKSSILKNLILLILFLGMGIILYSHFIGTKGLVVREYSVINNKLTDNFHGLKIVHFSDLHYGTTIHLKELKNIVKEINLLKPQIVFFTGDLIDNDANISKDELTKILIELNKINPEIVSYVVRGNHDHSQEYNEILKNVDIKLLDNKSELFYYNSNNPLLIIGLSDYLVGDQDINLAFANYNEEYYTILLMHEPDSVNNLGDYQADLILAGHSHNGQVRLPFIGSVLKVNGARSYYDSEYLIDNSPMYISGGLGTSKYPFRLFNHPSFNFYRLYNK